MGDVRLSLLGGCSGTIIVGVAMTEGASVREMQISTAGVVLPGDLRIPPDCGGLVVFAHGSGSSRHSPRNRAVADQLNAAGCGTLLFDLLTATEDERDRRTRELRFDIPLLGRRLVGTLEAIAADRVTEELRIGLFGASTGAAAALIAAADVPDRVSAVVSRGGRPDLAGDSLPRVEAATLLIVGGRDHEVIALNRRAKESMRCEVVLSIVPGAGHLFEEPGALSEVARLAIAWFKRTLGV